MHTFLSCFIYIITGGLTTNLISSISLSGGKKRSEVWILNLSICTVYHHRILYRNERHHELRFHVLSTFILPRSTYVPFTLGDMLPANLLHDDLQTGKHAGLQSRKGGARLKGPLQDLMKIGLGIAHDSRGLNLIALDKDHVRTKQVLVPIVRSN